MGDAERYLGRELLGGRFRVRRLLGEGGMGMVYEAEEPAQERVVALKVLRPEYARRKDVAARFRREARAMASLRHPRIAEVYLYGQLEDGAGFIAMEYLVGRDLAEELRRVGPLPLDRAVRIAAMVCEGLALAHDRGIVHRDLKPENCFLVEHAGEGDRVKLLDFGLARVSAAEKRPGSVDLTRLGDAIGTPEFMSPEQAQGLPVDHRTDVYALGLIVYEMLTGALPFVLGSERASQEMAAHHVLTPPRPLAEALPGASFPPGVQGVLDRCLAKRPEARFGEVRALAAALAAAAGG